MEEVLIFLVTRDKFFPVPKKRPVRFGSLVPAQDCLSVLMCSGHTSTLVFSWDLPSSCWPTADDEES